MADVETSVTMLGARMLKITVTGIDADDDESSQVDIHDYIDIWDRLGYPKRCSITAQRTAGSTDTVDVDLYASLVSGKNGTNVAGVTSTNESELGGEGNDLKPARYWTVIVPTVGSGNTLTVTVILQW